MKAQHDKVNNNECKEDNSKDGKLQKPTAYSGNEYDEQETDRSTTARGRS